MSKQITLDLSEELYEHAQRWATIIQRNVDETLTEALTIALIPKYTASVFEKPTSDLTDDETLALSKAKMKISQGERLHMLLTKQRESNLAEDERLELLALMQVYEQLWIRQSEALVEAVRRGLREP